jgi:hypothetical protein
MPERYDSPQLSEVEHAALDHDGVPGVGAPVTGLGDTLWRYSDSQTQVVASYGSEKITVFNTEYDAWADGGTTFEWRAGTNDVLVSRNCIMVASYVLSLTTPGSSIPGVFAKRTPGAHTSRGAYAAGPGLKLSAVDGPFAVLAGDVISFHSNTEGGGTINYGELHIINIGPCDPDAAI